MVKFVKESEQDLRYAWRLLLKSPGLAGVIMTEHQFDGADAVPNGWCRRTNHAWAVDCTVDIKDRMFVGTDNRRRDDLPFRNPARLPKVPAIISINITSLC